MSQPPTFNFKSVTLYIVFNGTAVQGVYTDFSNAQAAVNLDPSYQISINEVLIPTS